MLFHNLKKIRIQLRHFFKFCNIS